MPTRQFGRDRVELSGDRLTVITPLKDIPGWEVRKYRAPLIRFEGRTWRITSRSIGPESLTRYELVPWEPLDGEIPGPQIDYSPDAVVMRDHATSIGRRRSRVTMVLNYVTPLTGYLPARTKARLEALYGIDPVTSTKWSIFIEFLAALGSFVVASIGSVVNALGYPSGLPTALLVSAAIIVAVDGSMRWSRILDEDRTPPGFYEWLFRRKRT